MIQFNQARPSREVDFAHSKAADRWEQFRHLAAAAQAADGSSIDASSTPGEFLLRDGETFQAQQSFGPVTHLHYSYEVQSARPTAVVAELVSGGDVSYEEKDGVGALTIHRDLAGTYAMHERTERIEVDPRSGLLLAYDSHIE